MFSTSCSMAQSMLQNGTQKFPTGSSPKSAMKNQMIIVKPAQVVKRRHEPMRNFAARIGTNHDPLTLDGYARHWKEKRHLTSMPNEAVFDPMDGMATGEWIQRLVETVEIQAVLIEELNQNINALSAFASKGKAR